MSDLDWIEDEKIFKRGVRYRFTPSLSFREYKRLVKFIAESDDGILFWDGQPMKNIKFSFRNWLDYKLGKGIGYIRIDEEGKFSVSFNPSMITLRDFGS